MLFSLMELYVSYHGDYFRVGCRVHAILDSHLEANALEDNWNRNHANKPGTIFEVLLSDRSDICDFCGMTTEAITWNK